VVSLLPSEIHNTSFLDIRGLNNPNRRLNKEPSSESKNGTDVSVLESEGEKYWKDFARCAA